MMRRHPILTTLARLARAPGPVRVRLWLLALVLLAAARGALAAIDYPVDVATTRWALLNDATGRVVIDQTAWPRLNGRRYPIPGHTWLLRRVTPPPEVDQRIFELIEQRDIKPAKNELRITYAVRWRDRTAVEEDLDRMVIEHAATCAQGSDVQAACAVAAGLAQQVADGELTASDSERRRARRCAQWARQCVRTNEANGDRLLELFRTAHRTRNDPVPAPVPNLDDGWTDAPAP